MPLPGITLPGGFPAWLVDPHTSELDPVYAGVPMRTGHHRLRRVYTTAPEMRQVSLQLLEAQATQFHAWFENDLQAGALTFSARVANRGPGVVWFEARFVGDPPYEATPMHIAGGIGWRITATLRLTGEPQLSPPETGELASHVLIGLHGQAIGTTQKNLSSHVLVALQGIVSDAEMASHVLVPLIGIVETSNNVTVNGEAVTVNGDHVTVTT
jgi:hypothetical protein